MRTPNAKLLLGALSFALNVTPAGANPPAPVTETTANPAIDMPGYLRVSLAAAQHRETRRVSEAEFLRMSREPNTLVLDARSRDKYNELHVRGAIHLNFSDITVESLARTIPDKNTRILIYCNNNFASAEGPFPSKLPSASLNLSTYIALYNYGYRNVYELGPLIELSKSKLPFEPAPVKQAGA
jgi:phage shock protein E